MTSRSAPTAILVALTLFSFTISSCSGGDGPAGPDEQGGPTTGTATITPAEGGTVTAITADGAKVTLDFPPDAVRVETEVTVRPEPSAPGSWMTVALEPAGMVFFQPFDIDVTIPDGIDVTDAQLFLRPDDPVSIATTITGHHLTSSLTFFGFTPDTSVVVPSVSGLTSSASAGNGNQMAAQPFNCAQVVAQSRQRFDAFIAAEQYEDAIEAALDLGALLQKAACPIEAEQWIQQAAQIACDRLAAAIDDAKTTPTTSYGDFVAQTQPIFEWVVIVQKLDPTCQPIFDYPLALDNEITDFLDFFLPRLNALVAYDWSGFLDLKDEAVTVFKFMAVALQLGLVDGYDAVESKAFHPIIDQMRTIAFDLCRSGGWQYPLSRLTSTGFFAGRDIYGQTPPRPSTIISGPAPSRYASFTNDDIYEDIQYCAMCLEIKPLVVSGGKLDSTTVGSSGSPGVNKTDATLNTPTRGQIQLGGRMGAFTCWNDLAADKELVIYLNGVEVMKFLRPIAATEFFPTPELIDIGVVTNDANITPKEGEFSTLTIARRRLNCDARLWGPEEYQLATATLKWQNPTLDVSIEAPGELLSGVPTPVDVKVGVIDQLGGTSYFPNVLVDLDIVGGGATALSGQTDASGYFHTVVTASGTNRSAGAGGSSAMPTMTITANATSFEGVTGQDQATPNVRDEGAATLTSASRTIQANVHVLDVDDVQSLGSVLDGRFDETMSATGESTIGERTGSGNSSTTILSDVHVESGLLTTIDVSITGNADATASNLTTTYNDKATAGTGVNVDVQFDVVDKPLSYVLEVSGDGTNQYGGFVDFVDGKVDIKYGPVNTTFSGVLEPGSYRIRGNGSTSAYTDGNCGSCSESSSMQIRFKLTLGTTTAASLQTSRR